MPLDLKEYIDTLYFKDEYFPLSHLDNDFIDIMTTINSKDSSYEFTDVKSYKDYISRLKKTKHICNQMIHNMRKGIQKKMTISKIIVQSIINQLQELIINNTYDNEFNHYRKIPPSIKKEFLDTIDSYLIGSIRKMIQFLIDEYIERCRYTIGLCGLKNGKRLYRVMTQFITIKYEYQGNEEEYNPSWAQSS